MLVLNHKRVCVFLKCVLSKDLSKKLFQLLSLRFRMYNVSKEGCLQFQKKKTITRINKQRPSSKWPQIGLKAWKPSKSGQDWYSCPCICSICIIVGTKGKEDKSSILWRVVFVEFMTLKYALNTKSVFWRKGLTLTFCSSRIRLTCWFFVELNWLYFWDLQASNLLEHCWSRSVRISA